MSKNKPLTDQELKFLSVIRSAVDDNERLSLMINSDFYLRSKLVKKIKFEFPQINYTVFEKNRVKKVPTHAEIALVKQQERELEEQRRRVDEARRRVKKLLTQTGVKLLDLVIKDLPYWSRHKALLEENGILWADVEARNGVLNQRRAAQQAKAAEKKRLKHEENMAIVLAALPEHPYRVIGVQITPDPLDDKGLLFSFDAAAFVQGREDPLKSEILHSLTLAMRGFTGSCSPRGTTITAKTTPEKALKMFERADEVLAIVEDVREIRPNSLRTMNLPDTAKICGVPEAVFRDWAQTERVPVAEIVDFSKWGGNFTAKKFDPGTILGLVRDGTIARLTQEREAAASIRRARGTNRAKRTREARLEIKEGLLQEISDKRDAAVAKTGDVRSANHAELFNWAQIASRRAKTVRSEEVSCYALKDDALSTLFEVGALDISFINAEQDRLISKCDYHDDGWYDYYELMACRKCRFEKSHYYSLYAVSLKGLPGNGTLHVPYHSGLGWGFPPIGKVKNADHGRDEAYGRQLDDDEKSIFTLKLITSKMEALINLISLELQEDEDEEEAA